MNAVRRVVKQARREATEERILDAFEAVLSETGVRNLSLNAVVKKADVSKPLLYRYFGSLVGLVRAWGQRRPAFGDVDPIPPDGMDPSGDLKDQLEQDLLRIAEHLRTHPVTLEFLAEELTGENEFSAAFSDVRDQVRRASVRRMMRDVRFSEPENRRLIIVVYAAVVYMALRARHAPSFFGIKLDTDKGWDEVIGHVSGIFDDARLAAQVRRGER